MMSEEKQSIVLADRFLQTRSEKDFSRLYVRFTPSLYRLALHLHDGNGPAAEDAVQELWIRAIRGLSGFNRHSSLKTWLTGILINCIRESNRQSVVAEAAKDELGKVQDRATHHSGDVQLDVMAALSQLPAGYKEVLLLHDVEGYKHEEIGSLLGISPGTSKSQLFHARAAMKKMLV